MEQYNVLDSLPDAMMIVGGLALILVLLIILNSVHKQAKRMEELQAELADTTTQEVMIEEEQTNG